MVTASQLGKTFVDAKGRSVHAVQNLSFEAHPGQVFGLLGANGAGKSTTLRILSTMIAPTHGSATVNGINVVEHPEDVRRSIGFLSNSTGLYGRLSGREALQYFGELQGLSTSEAKTRIAELVDRFELGSFIDRICDTLSTGQRQRVNIARTVIHNPPVLFFDEPTAGLDVVMAQAVMEFIEEMRAAGKTIIFSTHIMSEVERLCDRIIVIHEGALQAEGTVDEIRTLGGGATLEAAFLKLIDYRREVRA
jgi:sodium transport system ATP-binding protein